jgi:hypothetical protein
MKRTLTITNIVAMLSLVMLFGVGVASAQRPVIKRKPVVRKAVRKPVTPVYTVDSGTVVRVRMDQTISSKTARAGNTFFVTVTEPVYSNSGVVVIPVGSRLTGRIDAVKPAAKGGKPGEIDARFVSVRLPNGRVRAINGSLTDLTGKTESDNEGTVSGDRMKHRKIIFIGGGAAGGAVLGAIVGGGKATAIGAILGAGAGFLGERLIKGPEAEVKSGTEFSVILNQSVALPRFIEANP